MTPIKLDQWCIVYGGDIWTAPEAQPGCLNGIVTGHPTLPEGYEITSSAIVGRMGDRILVATGSEYELGEPLPAYIAQFPDAIERLKKLTNFADEPGRLE